MQSKEDVYTLDTYLEISNDGDVAQNEDVEEIVPDSFSRVNLANESQLKLSTYKDGVQIDGLDVSITDVELPSMINGKAVLAVRSLGANVTSVVIPRGVQVIEENAFKNCVYLERIYISSTVCSIENKAFDNCLSLKEVVVSENNKYYSVRNNKLVYADGSIVASW